jgi:hypothetical protein
MPDGVNIPLLRKAVEWAEAEAAKPEIDRQWAQRRWVTTPEERARDFAEDGIGLSYREAAETLAPHCGTAYCIAGYVGQLLEPRYATSVTVDGVHVSEFAAEALGIDTSGSRMWHDPYEGQVVVPDLFEEDNTAADVRRIAEEIAGERL